MDRDRGYHNIQQLSDAVTVLEDAAGKSNTNAAEFLVSEIQPLKADIASLQKQVTELASQVKTLKG